MPLRIAYLSVTSSFSHSSPVYGQLRAFTEQNFKKETHWLNLEVSINESHDAAIQRIIEFKPEIILSTAYLFNIEVLLKILAKVSILLPEIVIALGGPEFLGNNEAFLRHNKFVSAVFRGDESSLPNFLECIKNKEGWRKIEGICYLDNNLYIYNGLSRFNGSLDALPSPYSKGYFSTNKPFIHFETSRGCPSHCLFCSSSNTPPQYYSLERVKADLFIIEKSGIREIRLLDRTFNIPEDRAISLIELFINSFPSLKFHIEIDPAKISERFFTAIKKAPKDMFHIEAGIQSFSIESLKAVNRSHDPEKLKKNLKALCLLPNIKVHTDLIAGLPYHKVDMAINDLYILAELNPDEIQIELLKLLPGSPLRNSENFNIKYSPFPPYEVLETQDISFSELSSIRIISRIFDSYYNENQLKMLIRFAIKTDKDFIHSFAALFGLAFSKREKPSINTRLKFILDYAVNSVQLYDMAIFTSLLMGIIPKGKKTIRLIKDKDLKNLSREIIWQNEHKLYSNIAVECSFDSDPAEFFLHGNISKNKSSSTYIFYYPTLSFSKTISHFEKVIKN
ncbi:MAG TPA: B12-binding domain-containing radical SAM protein [Lentisphaeria bacterium]|nr:MAG: hypothetical protein A2X47_00365 [Lentisphaerae bacterium GWF2_38_69]HBM14852.1 B12-binding domain-containing radical SAM protein [Lentisphaeria bacterium]